MDQVAPESDSYRGTLKRQPAFDAFDGSLFAVFPSLSEEQALQEVPTGLDAISHDAASCELPLLTPCSKAVMSQALKATFSGFQKEQRRLGIPKSEFPPRGAPASPRRPADGLRCFCRPSRRASRQGAQRLGSPEPVSVPAPPAEP